MAESKEEIVLGPDGKPTNTRYRNMFAEEVILTEKQKMRNALVDDRDQMKELLKTMTPTDIFILFDEDDSGLISFDEFRKMLPYLDINISDAKAFRYFRMCDTDGSGEIDIDEFQVALFACDPTSGNPVGFQPSKHLTPIDAFEMFDEDQSGFLDEDEFRYAIDYLSLPVNDELLEDLFYKHDSNFTGKIDYVEFREIFLEICNLRKELEDRGVDCPSFIRKKTMRKLLREILLDEERKERAALAEARRYKKWILNIRASKKILLLAEHRAYQELRAALDAAGHVYVIGSGNNGQFGHKGLDRLETKKFKFENFDRVVDLWRDRIQPQQLVDRLKAQRRAQEQEDKRDAERNLNGLGAIGRMQQEKKIVTDPYMEALESPFNGLNVQMNTASLWGKRVHEVALTENVIFALSDTGEVYTWGGNSYWWHEIQPDSVYQTKWRGDITARSQLLLGIKDKTLPPDVNLASNIDQLTPDDRKAEMIKVVAKYYNVWEPPPVPAQRMIYLDKDILPKIEYDQVKFALTCRGKRIGEMTKMQLVEELYQDILLEKKLLGERAHKAIREIEIQIAGLQKRKKTKLAEQFLKRIDDMWSPLREVQAENRANEIAKNIEAEQNAQVMSLTNYTAWRTRIGQKRGDMLPQLSPRGNSLQIDLIGATPRGPPVVSPRGYQSAVQIAAGSAHACLVHKNGQLYTWGVGVAGRLGLDLTEGGNPQANAPKPRLLQALSERPVMKVACGYSHTGAIVAGGELFMWGSTSSGKCGFGDVVAQEECYCSVPTKVMIGVEDRRVKKISCGSAHTGVITEAGQLFMFGCGDGGRLGSGPGRYETLYTPRVVNSLTHEKLASISCGNTTTIVCTAIQHEWVGDLEDKNRTLSGGRVYIAGSRNVLGKQCDEFTLLKEVERIPIKLVSAGYLHSALVSADGELFCWGHNRKGCCGQPMAQHFIESPTSVKFLYTSPANLAFNQRAYQSSTYNSRDASYAVNGRTEGLGVNKATCTQQESQPWIEIDLGKMAVIDRVVIWNRTDVPADKNQPRDLYTSRLFPCWVMVGRDPFPKDANLISLKDALRQAVAKAKLTEDKRCSTWVCPVMCQGRYVRVQLERFNPLSVAEIEVFGYWGFTQGVGRVSFASCGRDVTVAVCRPSTDPRDVEILYKRAAYADSANADILKQLETYTLEFDKYGRGEVLTKDCVICKGVDRCESCMLYQTYARDIESMPPVIGGRRRRLKSISDFLINSNKPPLEPVAVVQSTRPTKWELRKQAIVENLSFLQYFRFSRKRKNYVTPAQALESDPDVLMNKLKFVSMIDDKKFDAVRNQAEHGGNMESVLDSQLLDSHGDGESIPYSQSSSQKNATKHKKNFQVGSVGSLSQSERLGTASGGGGTRHGYTEKNVKMEVGDVLPTGHIVKEAYPRSIAKQLQMAYEAEEQMRLQAERDLAEMDAAREKKKNREKFMQEKK